MQHVMDQESQEGAAFREQALEDSPDDHKDRIAETDVYHVQVPGSKVLQGNQALQDR